MSFIDRVQRLVDAVLDDKEWVKMAAVDVVAYLDGQKQAREEAPSDVVDRARTRYALKSDDNIEIDEEGIQLSRADDGTWVQAWVWVPDPEEEEDE